MIGARARSSAESAEGGTGVSRSRERSPECRLSGPFGGRFGVAAASGAVDWTVFGLIRRRRLPQTGHYEHNWAIPGKFAEPLPDDRFAHIFDVDYADGS